MKLLTTHSTSRISYCLCLFMQIQFQWGSQLHPCMHNEAHSIANLATRFNPYFGSNNYRQHKPGLNLVDLLQNVFHLCMDGYNQLPSWNCACMNRHKIVASVACGVGSQQFHNQIYSQLATCFIVIPTPFLNFHLLIFQFVYILLYNRTSICALKLILSVYAISLCMCHTHFCN